MAKCTNCGRPVPDGAKFCGHCGKTTYAEPNQPQQPPFKQYQVTAHDSTAQANAAVAGEKVANAKPNCDLSVAGFILSVFNPMLCVISFILCAAALVKKQVRRKLALAGLFISLIEIVLFGVGAYLVMFVFPEKGIDISQYLPFLKQQ